MKKNILITVIIIVSAILLFFFLKANFQNEIYINPIAFSLGIFEVHWYGIIIAGAIILGYLIARKLAMNEGILEEHVAEAIIVAIIFAIAGARLWYVFSRWDIYRLNPLDIFKTWNGGMAIHGGVVGGILGIFLYTKLRKKGTMGFIQALDIGAVVIPLGQAIGRWGNFFNHEAYGSPTNLPWKMYIPFQFRMPGYENNEYFHPTFLYESLWDLGVFILLLWYFKKKRKNLGEVFPLYFILYSIGRFFVESLRLDSLYWGDFRAARFTSILLICFGVILFLYFRFKGNKVQEKKQ
ncbi:MAG: prolipoprotein diacylglyceryl transferase [Candidatus Cloacimonetes bacterium]|nr:prolipoprotein diacylglyceryl transferase [Candidatus Cloacimonadota bacterium]